MLGKGLGRCFRDWGSWLWSVPEPQGHSPCMPGLSTSGGLFLWREVWKLSLPQTCLSLLSVPPYLQQKLPRGLLALRVPPEWSHSWLGWGLFSFFGSCLLFQGLPPPHQWSWSTSPFWLPQPSPMPRPHCWGTSQVARPWAEKQNTM